MLKVFVVSVHVAHLKCECELEVESIHEGFPASYISTEYIKDNSFSPGELL
jgi:hypothetical protein